MMWPDLERGAGASEPKAALHSCRAFGDLEYLSWRDSMSADA